MCNILRSFSTALNPILSNPRPRLFSPYTLPPPVMIGNAMLFLFQDIEAWVPPTPPGKVLLDSLAACAKVLFEGDGNESPGRGIAATGAADVMSRG